MALRGYGTPICHSDRPVLGARYGLHWAYAAPDGGPVPRTETVWRNIAGILINTPRGAVWLHFRRWGELGMSHRAVHVVELIPGWDHLTYWNHLADEGSRPRRRAARAPGRRPDHRGVT
jgi:hypothetical protein